MSSYYDNSYLNTIQTRGAHPEPRLRFKRSGASAELQRGKHHSLQLSKVVISQLPPYSRPSMLQEEALSDWGRVKQQYGTNFLLPNVKEMLHIIDIFSRIFFLGKLGRVEFEWTRGLCDSEEALGATFAPGPEDAHWARIIMDPAELLDESGAPDHFTSIMSTLLHECIHAFLLSYSCEMACTDAECDRTWSQIVGETFHGMAFLQIATYLEAFAKDNLLEAADLSIWTTMTQEYDDEDVGCILKPCDIAYCHKNSHAEMMDFANDPDKASKQRGPRHETQEPRASEDTGPPVGVVSMALTLVGVALFWWMETW